MTNIKARGFESTAQLNEHLDDLAEEASVKELPEYHDEFSDQKEIAWLREEVADLRERLSIVREQTAYVEVPSKQEINPWLRIAVMVGTTYVLGRMAQRLRLGAPGAVAVPMIAAQLDRRFW